MDSRSRSRRTTTSTHTIEQGLLAEHRERERGWADVRGASNRLAIGTTLGQCERVAQRRSVAAVVVGRGCRGGHNQGGGKQSGGAIRVATVVASLGCSS